ncbi:MAG: radical SAM protein, partial [Deltaproteobacteria bacterium]|nr:radical SAM protein [Deltaproteobacteria bacterium]
MMLSPLKQEVKESEAISLIYISIPFCKYLCHFCTFARQFGKELFHIQKLKTRYLQTIKKELAVKSATATAKHKVDLKGIHFGGGTPSLLEVEDFAGILSAIEELFHQDVRKIQEVGLEANPDSLTLEKLRGLKSLGFNRISMGLQTFNPDILKRINRQHSVEQFYQAYEWARQAGFENINIDLIYGIPEQTFADVEKDLETVVNLDPDHIAPSPLLPVQSPLFRIGPDEELKRKTMTREWAP